ncbi:hypothetical protein [Streptomyces sp. NPDC093225]|uniref:hypothetical protein n=1 Tax=Streptomyces sp. NPDC093225 TaxID=3366034 RepID=UPI00380B95E6
MGTSITLVYIVGLVVLAILIALAIALRRVPAQHKPEVIRALAELMHFWHRK